MPLGLRRCYTCRRAGWRCRVSPRPAGRIYAAYTLLVLVGCGTPARQVPHEQPLLNLSVLRSLEPIRSLKLPPTDTTPRERVSQEYLLDMEPLAAEDAVARDPTVSFRTKEMRTIFGYSADYIIDGRPVRVHIFNGEGKDALPPGHCYLDLNG